MKTKLKAFALALAITSSAPAYAGVVTVSGDTPPSV